MVSVKFLEKEVKRLRNIEGKLHEAVRLLENSLLEVKKEEKPAALNALANLYLDVGKTEKSIETFKTVIRLAKETRDELTEANALRKLGYIIWKTKQDKKKAISLAKESLVITNRHSEDEEFQKVAASAWAAIGNAEFDSGQIKKSLKAYEKGLELAHKSNYIERVSTILGDIGYVHIARGHFGKAEMTLLEAEKIGREKYRHELPAALLRLGYVYFDSRNPKRDLAKAKDYFEESLAVAKKEGWRREQADAYFALGKVHQEEGDKRKARNHFNKAISIYKEIKMPGLAKQVKAEFRRLN